MVRHIKNVGWECICSCGKIRIADGDALRTNKAKSCGCIASKNDNQFYKSKIYIRWQSMAGKGILSEEFKDFSKFSDYIYINMSPYIEEFSITRIDKNRLIERGNIKIKYKKHKKNICGTSFTWCTLCEKYIEDNEKFWSEAQHACKLCRYKWKIKKDFGLEYHQYIEMVNKCNRKCQICEIDLKIGVSSRNACLDHCHKTNTVRGILCSNCNTGLGMFKDSEQNLEKAKTYLKRGI